LACSAGSINPTAAKSKYGRRKKHPDKTFIGKIERGFDYLGYRFGPGVLKLADTTIECFVAHNEQGRRERRKAPLLGRCIRRWRGWAKGGIMGTGTDCANALSHSIGNTLGLLPVTEGQAR
jgi:hypothetical protein